MIIGIAGKINSGKDTVGKIIQYLTDDSEFPDNYTVLDKIDNYGSHVNGRCQWQIKKFADKLKDIICILLGCTRKQLEDHEFKDKELGKEWWYWKETNSYDYSYVKLHPYNEKPLGHCILIKLTPRLLLQLLGTECGRQIIHPNIWVNSLFADYKSTNIFKSSNTKRLDINKYEILDNNIHNGKIINCNNYEYKLDNLIFPNWIITDVRFKNELQAIKDRGGITIRVVRPCKECGVAKGHKLDCSIGRSEHSSEKDLDNEKFDFIVHNGSTIEDLAINVKEILKLCGMI